MKAVFSEGYVTFHRDKTDPRFHGNRFARGEHNLFQFVKKWLNVQRLRRYKKRAQKDGHLIGDVYQPYLRCRKPGVGIPTSTSGPASMRCVEPTRNGMAGKSRCYSKPTCSGKRQDTMSMIAALCQRHPDEMRMERPAIAVA